MRFIYIAPKCHLSGTVVITDRAGVQPSLTDFCLQLQVNLVCRFMVSIPTIHPQMDYTTHLPTSEEG